VSPIRLIALFTALLGLAVAGGFAVSEAGAKPKQRVQAGLFKTAAEYIGVERKQLLKELRGHSLAQVAVAHGKTEAGLEAAVLANVKARLDKAVAEKRMSAAHAQRISNLAPALVDRLVNHVWKGRPAARAAVARANAGFIRAAAAYVGIAPAQLRAELKGHSLAQVAVAHGKSVDGLKQALLDAAKARLDKASRLSAERKARILNRVQSRIDRLVNRVFA
jgi:hypothetical protein